MAPKDLDKLIERYLAGTSTKEENEFIDAWYSAMGQHPHAEANILEDTLPLSERRILENIRTHTGLAAERENKRRNLLWPSIGIAASLLLVASAGFYFLKQSSPGRAVTEQEAPSPFISVSNSDLQEKRVILPDGSLVEMSPASNIRYSNDTNSALRELYLEGEAYFDVARNPDRPFFVYAGDIVTRVLGTSFTIRAKTADEQVTVSVKTGSVTVYSKKASHKKTLLAPNQHAVYDRATDVLATRADPVKESDDVGRYVNEMHFEETSVAEVLKTLTDAYNINIIFDPQMLSGCVLTSSFYEEGLYDRIDVICTAIGATYKVVDAQIVIDSKGCNQKPI